jgi:valyl-tRNA synthetase
LWNVARYILEKLPDDYSPPPPVATSLADKWIIDKFSRETKAVTQAIESYRFSEAGERIYSLLWSDFADWYIEASKVEPNLAVLVFCLETVLKLAHPFAPFVTEAIWQEMPWQKDNLITNPWPPAAKKYPEAAEFEQLIALISQIRGLASDLKLSQPALLHQKSPLLEDNAELVKRLARVGDLKRGSGGLGLQFADDAWLNLDKKTIATYRTTLEKRKREAGEYLKRLQSQLANQKYLESAPAHLVQQTRDRQRETELLVSKLDEQIQAIRD